MQKFRKGDEVIVIAGKDKGKRGIIAARIDVQRLLIDGVNLVKKHVKPNPMKGVVGGISEKSMPIHQSNVALFDVSVQKKTRSSVHVDAQGKRTRVLRSSAVVAIAATVQGQE
ncbi:MAG: 50S ribosomal protein L24 [Burkholderiaceae bacterium]|jgi:large subunit ribosomal protein L24